MFRTFVAKYWRHLTPKNCTSLNMADSEPFIVGKSVIINYLRSEKTCESIDLLPILRHNGLWQTLTIRVTNVPPQVFSFSFPQPMEIGKRMRGERTRGQRIRGKRMRGTCIRGKRTLGSRTRGKLMRGAHASLPMANI
jgi:hypothetical protein